jgi:hypothetical protein
MNCEIKFVIAITSRSPRKRRMMAALATDKHFEQEGFTRLLTPEA